MNERWSVHMAGSGGVTSVKNAIVFAGCAMLVGGMAVASWSGCGAVTGALGAVGNAKGTADAAKGLGDSAKDTADATKGAAAPGAGDKGAADDTRLQATESGINAPLDDTVDNKKDPLDWRKFNLKGKAGVATFEVHWDDEKADLSIDVYNSFGDLVGKSPRRLQGMQAKRILIQVDNPPALYYVKVAAPNKDEKSIYTLKVLWDGEKVDKGKGGDAQAAAPPPAAAPAAAAPPPAAAAPPAAPPPPVPFAQDPNKVLGKIVTAYRDGQGWVLQ